MKKAIFYEDNGLCESGAAEIAGVVNSGFNAATSQTHYDKFNASQGHGFAAEQANNLYDLLMGKDARVVGGDNAKNGADRFVNDTYIQTKYCRTASNSVAAAFEIGQYRYINPDGSLMQLEVPADQYDRAVELMAKRISGGEVPGVKDPNEAGKIVRKGHFTYQQAVNIAKFGTVESISYDAANGAIISASAFGITAVLTLAQALWSGESPELAIERAAYSGIQVGGAAFISSVISAQLSRTFVGRFLISPSETIVSLLGKDSSNRLALALKSGANVYGSTAMNGAEKLLKSSLLTATVMTIVLSSGDIRNAFRGRISGKQLFKNISVRVGSMAGAVAGAQIGSYVLNIVAPGAGNVAAFVVSIAGSAVGGAASGKAVCSFVGKFIEDDAVYLVSIIEKEFCALAQDYLLCEDEVEIILEDIFYSLEENTLLDMFASEDRKKFAQSFLINKIEKTVCGRCRILLPSTEDFIIGIGRLINDFSGGKKFTAKSVAKADAVAIGRELMGQELPEHTAKKAWYATKQMNLAQSQAEMLLRQMVTDEKTAQRKINSLRLGREELKNELNKLIK